MNELVMVVAAWAFFLAALDFFFLVIAGRHAFERPTPNEALANFRADLARLGLKLVKVTP